MIHPDTLPALLKGANRAHFEAAGQGRVCVPRCGACGHHFFPAATVCPKCLGEDIAWAEVSGRATLRSWCEFHRAYFPALREKVPYRVLLVQLEEGPSLYGNLVGTDPSALRVGLPLRAVCTPGPEGAGTVDYQAAG